MRRLTFIKAKPSPDKTKEEMTAIDAAIYIHSVVLACMNEAVRCQAVAGKNPTFINYDQLYSVLDMQKPTLFKLQKLIFFNQPKEDIRQEYRKKMQDLLKNSYSKLGPKEKRVKDYLRIVWEEVNEKIVKTAEVYDAIAGVFSVLRKHLLLRCSLLLDEEQDPASNEKRTSESKLKLRPDFATQLKLARHNSIKLTKSIKGQQIIRVAAQERHLKDEPRLKQQQFLKIEQPLLKLKSARSVAAKKLGSPRVSSDHRKRQLAVEQRSRGESHLLRVVLKEEDLPHRKGDYEPRRKVRKGKGSSQWSAEPMRPLPRTIINFNEVMERQGRIDNWFRKH